MDKSAPAPRRRRAQVQILTITTVVISVLGLLIAYLSLAGDRGWPPFAFGTSTSAPDNVCPASDAPTISLSADTARPGESVIIRGTGWGKAKVTLRYTPSHVNIADMAPGRCGQFEHNWSVPNTNPSRGPDPLLFMIEAVQEGSTAPISSTAALRLQPPVTVTINVPRNGASAPRCSNASGSATNLTADKILWLVIQVPDNEDRPHRYYLDFPLSVDGSGQWSQQITVGSQTDGGRPYWVQIYVADAAKSKELIAGSGEALQSVPDFFEKAAEAKVVRLDGDNC